jgi:hypothetical protein
MEGPTMPRAASPLPAPLAKGARRFAAWRSHRTSHRIPEELWSLAVELASRHGVSRTARALGVQHPDLKRRLDATEDRGAVGAGPAGTPAFVEFVTTLPPSRPAPDLESAWRVEIEHPSGAKMRIEGKDALGRELVELSRLFLEARRP